ncbi:hypothetical protein GQ43DRAFT_409601 [Delitschia confertaspora ATCC 74209]|uniref:Sensitive to high expression protein 9, mitochondrial n=1 Tax=Delitschia confertaspora ATCC 74209 TaxID=1513339 RepID=A0A9P4MV77_9PLEO|nr:hypothetical protein GQ43DRAFT_409601 [Delitschia confertaspora ATCC 74209]
MRPLLQHASRLIRHNALFLPTTHRNSQPLSSILHAASGSPSIYLQCQFRKSSLLVSADNRRFVASILDSKLTQHRSLSSSRTDSEKPIELPGPSTETKYSSDTEKPIELPGPSAETKSPSDTEPSLVTDSQLQSPEATNPESQPRSEAVTKHQKDEDTINRVPDEDLPSHRERQRWDLSKQFSKLMDELLPKLAIVTQKVNTYTGTDYSGIAALRREIKEQEKFVKSRRVKVEEAKQALDEAHAQQASSQKEVVGLLERKHSWSAADLERYMSLIRSEHLNDQAVNAAKENVQAAETALEEARTHLEKRERAQYHEEQIWSDTIRRNSTWVTFGLMGVNIFLLLASLLFIEPWRRRRMVREIRSALDEHKIAMQPAMAAESVTPAQQKPAPPTETQSTSPIQDQAIELVELPSASPVDTQSTPATEVGITATVQPTAKTQETIEVPDESLTMLPGAVEPALDNEACIMSEAAEGSEIARETEPSAEEEAQELTPSWAYWKNKITAEAEDLISERPISIRKVDYTAAILQGVCAGAFIAGSILLVLIKRN